ncbi:MAG TPA: ATP-binding protein [Haliangiales bacterium]|nr:ATP-binding protein [Haliangiales bacterium]
MKRLRLGHKLALSLSMAALLPVAAAAVVSVSIVLRGLERGLAEQTTRQLRVGMNLVLRTVERLGGDAQRLASTPGLGAAVGQGEPALGEVLTRELPHLPSAMVRVADDKGHIVAQRAVGGDEPRFGDIGVPAAVVEAGLAYERRVTLTPGQGMLVVHAVAPIVDPSLALRGVVVVSLPLDGDFADGIKGALGTDVLIYAGADPAMSSFLDHDGARLHGLSAPGDVAERVLAGGTLQIRATIAGEEFSLGYAPLKDIDGKHVGMLAVAVGRGALAGAKNAAFRSLTLGAAGAIAFALALAGLLTRRLSRPIGRLHAGALAIARGELDTRLTQTDADPGDEIGDLARAFTQMTASLRENQDRLAARMREIVALHEAGRAVSSVLGVDEVLRKIVDSIARVLDTRLAALWLVDAPRLTDDGEIVPEDRPTLRIGAARSKGIERPLEGQGILDVTEPLSDFATEVARDRFPVRIDDVDEAPRFRTAARAAGIDGSLLAVPLERGNLVVGVLVVGRAVTAPPFTGADESLLSTFADQAATAIENARLYEEVRAFSEELEEKVRLRTRELTSMNAELGRAIGELRDTQAQLVFSERMAGLGSLVAGVAHEINSPSAAIRGSVDALSENVRRLAKTAREVGELPLSDDDRKRFLALAEELAPRLAEKRVGSPAALRRHARQVVARLAAAGITGAEVAGRGLVEIGAEDDLEALLPLLAVGAPAIVRYLREYTYLHRNAFGIDNAIRQIQRIVGALKSYSHLDQAKVEVTDLHEGIENTLTILHHELKYGIQITRKYGHLPTVPVYVDELNQVWTNLIHNAAQALRGKGEIVIETELDEPAGMVRVKVIDDGPGIPTEIRERIFEPFFTTKAKGEGTGLGLGIVRKIVDKHGGTVSLDSAEGRTCFTVSLLVSGPKAKIAEEEAGQGAQVA